MIIQGSLDMKNILLSVVAIATVTTAATAKSDIDILKEQMAMMSEKINALEAKETSKGVIEIVPIASESTKVKSKVPVLKFSGKHYLGFVSSKRDGDERKNRFETRRNYFQVKAYFADQPKSYLRITLDTHQVDDGRDTVGKDLDGTWNVRLKYAYLYLDNVLPYTGVEIGQVHRPWIDYEEHGGWNYRSVSKVFVEASNGAHLTNSADLGINFKTKTEYFSSELGLFNGEGYHNVEDGKGLSAEWRLTGHILGGGSEKSKKDHTYANISLLGQYNAESNKHKNEDLNWYGVHAVYNQPEFLIAAQYIDTIDADTHYAGKGWSVNGEFRVMGDWNIIGRYDSFELDTTAHGEQTTAIVGVTYKYNKNVEFIVNYLGETNLYDSGEEQDAMMLTAEVNW
jgi:hypothetical protein